MLHLGWVYLKEYCQQRHLLIDISCLFSVHVILTALLVSDRPVLFLTVTAAVAGQLAPATQLQGSGFPVEDVTGAHTDPGPG